MKQVKLFFMLDIKVRNIIWFDTRAQKYCAELRIYLPTINKVLHPLLINEKDTIFGQELHYHIGKYSEKYNMRYIDNNFHAKTIEELNKQIDSIISDAVKKLKTIYNENKKQITELKEEYDIQIE